ncbi:hypothetical protein LHYA1_G006586 [Lachnellula hyalina]|uniref:Uncharacterized protein n=1 Tax=Lachnellula hyalina TaxID=1316788 RepID=A0A8H8R0D2_9HELO|nr:uncharacterized protein LHYA1_G006586 [Lachnellula hyalina]TVY25371.1 hypothetical protein LHYA1_G006586 [Lachnellula hyalina]
MPTPTPTQRPFFASFLAAFRAHSSIPQPKTSPSPTPASTQSPSTSQSHPTSHTQPRTITSKPGATSAALSTLHSPRTHSTSPRAGPERQTEGAGAGAGRYPTRRGSDSSSEGFRDVLGKEKWYIGGRTATGEERYFKLGVVRRQRSGDRLSLDRLSL